VTCPVCGPGKRKKRRARQEAPTWESIAAAIALITAERTGSGDSVADLIGDQEPARVLRAQALIPGAVLDVLAPGQAGLVLGHLGLVAAERSAE
jgi:hypothetical protein